MNQLAFFFLENSFGLAHVDQSLDVVAVVLFFIFIAVFEFLFLPSRTIKQTMKRIGGESHQRQERTNYRQEKQQRSFGIARGNEQRNELTKDAGKDQTGEQSNQYKTIFLKQAQRNRGDQNGDGDQQNLNRGRNSKAKPRAIFEHLLEEG